MPECLIDDYYLIEIMIINENKDVNIDDAEGNNDKINS